MVSIYFRQAVGAQSGVYLQGFIMFMTIRHLITPAHAYSSKLRLFRDRFFSEKMCVNIAQVDKLPQWRACYLMVCEN